MKKAADMVVLIENRKELFGLGTGKLEGAQRNRFSWLGCKAGILPVEFWQRKHGDGACGLGGHGPPLFRGLTRPSVYTRLPHGAALSTALGSSIIFLRSHESDLPDRSQREDVHGHRSRANGAGLFAERSVRPGREAFRFCRKEEPGPRFLSARLEPGLHQRARLPCKRHEEI